MKIVENGQTVEIEAPTWNGRGFDETLPNDFWNELPADLRAIATAECSAGNSIGAILKNSKRDTVLISLTKPPISDSRVGGGISVHTAHKYGNYCYDGTCCTYEHQSSGCFIAFEDPNYVQEAY